MYVLVCRIENQRLFEVRLRAMKIRAASEKLAPQKIPYMTTKKPWELIVMAPSRLAIK